ncbi:MAG: orotidine-5'-phosphate decarboxylase [Candidatus Caenarcaniphilales bacterium]|nr:orotidine-5'-phosphate decarboxylase [Candidatus Caenarcaniphilales bacterium]
MSDLYKKIALALDLDTEDQVSDLLSKLNPQPATLKIGLQLVYSLGLKRSIEIVEKLSPESMIFLDLKLHDIPNTVAKALKSILRLKIERLSFLTLHTLGGMDMLKAAQEEVQDKVNLAGVTILTSHQPADFEKKDQAQLQAYTLELAFRAKEVGIKWLVCSAQEIPLFQTKLPAMQLITPGIRPDGTSKDDQARIATPRSALEAGSDLLVIGRPVYRALDPAKAWSDLLTGIS